MKWIQAWSRLKILIHRTSLRRGRQTFKDLANKDIIVIKPADKGSAVVIMNTADYIKEGERQLNDPLFYKNIDNNLTATHNDQIHTTIDDMAIRGELSGESVQYLKKQDPSPSQL